MDDALSSTHLYVAARACPATHSVARRRAPRAPTPPRGAAPIAPRPLRSTAAALHFSPCRQRHLDLLLRRRMPIGSANPVRRAAVVGNSSAPRFRPLHTVTLPVSRHRRPRSLNAGRPAMNRIRSSSVAIAITGIPYVSRTSCTPDFSPVPRSIRSSAISTPAGVAPCARIRSTDSRTDVPAEMTSSTISTRPASGAPMTLPPSP